MKKFFIIIIMFVNITVSAYGQQNKTIKALSVGDKIPDELLSTMLRKADGENISLSKVLNGRHLVIDFFATWCIPCVKALPEIQDLQESFKEKLLILPITSESSTVLKPFLKNQTFLNGTLDFVSNDQLLRQYFPHRMVPHEVWINNSGIVVAITDGNVLKRAGIERFIADNNFNPQLKKDEMNLNINKPLFINGNGGADTSFTYRSIAGKYIPGGSSSDKIVREGNGIRKYTATNAVAVNLFTTAFSRRKLYIHNWNYIVANVRDSSRLTYKPGPITTEWREKNMYSYELSFKKAVPDTIFFKHMMEDLNRILDLTCEVRKKEVLCYVISRENLNDNILKTKTEKITGPYQGKMRNLPFDRLVEQLCNYKESPPFINETGITFNVDMDFDFSPDLRFPLKLEEVKSTLNKYGLALKQEMRSINVMYIKDKPEF